MPFKLFSVPTVGGLEFEEELNSFLRRHQVVGVERKLVEQGSVWMWSFCVDYLERQGLGKRTSEAVGSNGRGRVDYKELLSAEEFAIFCKIKATRKELAEAEKVPMYVILSNEQAAAIARTRPTSLEGLGKIEGIGGERLKKYGRPLLDAIKGGSGSVAIAAGGEGA